MEWASKVWEDPSGERGLVIPVVVQPTPRLPPLLAPLVRVDLVGCDEVEAERRLTEAVRGRSAPTGRPLFPGFSGSAVPREQGLRAFRPPYRFRSRYFTGRDALLAQLEKSIVAPSARAVPLALCGPMGVGKTALASEHAFRCRSHYAGVWTINCENSSVADASFASLADEMQLVRRDASLSEKVAASYQFLDKDVRSQQFLLIFDNAETPADIAEFVSFAGVRAIITSRNPEWAGIAEVSDLLPLSSTEGQAFLQARAGQTSESAQHLAEALGCLPLALEQAAAYCSECQLSLASYLHQHEERLVESRAAAGSEYPSSLAASVLESAREARRGDSLSGQFLDAVALLTPDPIPRALLYEIGNQHDVGPVGVDRSLARLRRFALIKLTPDAASVHRAIRTILRAETQAPRTETARHLLKASSATFPVEPFEHSDAWPACAALWSHIGALRELRDEAFTEEGDRVRYCALLNSVGGWLHATGQYEAADAIFHEVIDWAAPIARHFEAEFSSWQNDLALLLWERGDPVGAQGRCRRSLRIGRRRLGATHHLVATRHNNLALIEEKLGRFRFAELHYRLALALRIGLLGPDASLTANTLANYGDMLRLVGRFDEAEALLLRARDAAEGHPEAPIRLGQALNALAALFMDTCRTKQAVSLLDRAESLFASVYPENHPALAKVRARLTAAKSASEE